MSVELILIRHGQSLYNLENRFTGWRDVDITETGVHEAHGVAQQLKGVKIDIAFTSCLMRAQHTLQIILDDCGLQSILVQNRYTSGAVLMMCLLQMVKA